MLEDIAIDRKSPEAVSNQIARYLRSRIADKTFKAGDRLPTTHEVIALAGVGSHTVRQAINILEEEGLVESRQRRGTIVKGKMAADVFRSVWPLEAFDGHNGHNSNNVRRLAVMGAVGTMCGSQAVNNPIYREDLIAGILQECETRRIAVQILPSKLRGCDAQEVYQTIKDFRCDGVIWHNAAEDHRKAIEYLVSQSIPVVVTSRSRLNAKCSCIESDYEQAGFAAGEHLIKIGSDSVMVFTHFTETANRELQPLGENPYGISRGISRAFEVHGLDSRCIAKTRLGPNDVCERIFTCIEKLDKNTSLVFTNGYHFLDLIKNKGEQAQEVLSDREIIVLSNHAISVQLAPFMAKLDPMVLIDPFEEIGRFAVQKLLGVIDGYLADTTTLAQIRFERFSNLGFTAFNKTQLIAS